MCNYIYTVRVIVGTTVSIEWDVCPSLITHVIVNTYMHVAIVAEQSKGSMLDKFIETASELLVHRNDVRCRAHIMNALF